MRILPLVLFVFALGGTIGARWISKKEPFSPDALAREPTERFLQEQELCSTLHGSDAKVRLDSIQKEITHIRDLRRAFEGDPIPWPDPLDSRLQPAAIEEASKRALEVATRELTWVDANCEEYPCIVVVDDPEPRWDHRTYGWTGKSLTEAVQQDPRYKDIHVQGLTWKMPYSDGSRYQCAAMALFAEPPTLEETVRVRMRITALNRMAVLGQP